MNRRGILLAGAGVGIASLGLGAALRWFSERRTADDLRAASEGIAQAPAATEPIDVWPLRFARPEGGELAMADLRGRPLVLNFWAPWCAPCVEEMPMLDTFHREQGAKGWQVAGLAIDSPEPVRDFLVRHPVTFPIGIAGLQGATLARSLGNLRGALPFSVIYDGGGNVVTHKLGVLTASELAAWTKRG